MVSGFVQLGFAFLLLLNNLQNLIPVVSYENVINNETANTKSPEITLIDYSIYNSTQIHLATTNYTDVEKYQCLIKPITEKELKYEETQNSLDNLSHHLHTSYTSPLVIENLKINIEYSFSCRFQSKSNKLWSEWSKSKNQLIAQQENDQTYSNTKFNSPGVEYVDLMNDIEEAHLIDEDPNAPSSINEINSPEQQTKIENEFKQQLELANMAYQNEEKSLSSESSSSAQNEDASKESTKSDKKPTIDSRSHLLSELLSIDDLNKKLDDNGEPKDTKSPAHPITKDTKSSSHSTTDNKSEDTVHPSKIESTQQLRIENNEKSKNSNEMKQPNGEETKGNENENEKNSSEHSEHESESARKEDSINESKPTETTEPISENDKKPEEESKEKKNEVNEKKSEETSSEKNAQEKGEDKSINEKTNKKSENETKNDKKKSNEKTEVHSTNNNNESNDKKESKKKEEKSKSAEKEQSSEENKSSEVFKEEKKEGEKGENESKENDKKSEETKESEKSNETTETSTKTTTKTERHANGGDAIEPPSSFSSNQEQQYYVRSEASDEDKPTPIDTSVIPEEKLNSALEKSKVEKSTENDMKNENGIKNENEMGKTNESENKNEKIKESKSAKNDTESSSKPNEVENNSKSQTVTSSNLPFRMTIPSAAQTKVMEKINSENVKLFENEQKIPSSPLGQIPNENSTSTILSSSNSTFIVPKYYSEGSSPERSVPSTISTLSGKSLIGTELIPLSLSGSTGDNAAIEFFSSDDYWRIREDQRNQSYWLSIWKLGIILFAVVIALFVIICLIQCYLGSLIRQQKQTKQLSQDERFNRMMSKA